MEKSTGLCYVEQTLVEELQAQLDKEKEFRTAAESEVRKLKGELCKSKKEESRLARRKDEAVQKYEEEAEDRMAAGTEAMQITVKYGSLLREYCRMENACKKLQEDHSREVIRGAVTPTRAKADAFRKSIHRFVDLAKQEYDQLGGKGPTLGYTGGVNLFRRLKDHSDDYYRFLTDLRIPPTNWAAGTNARILKRKAHPVMCFRSFNGLACWCDAQFVLHEFLEEGDAMFEKVSEIFDRLSPNRRGPNKGKTAAIDEAMRVDPESEEFVQYVRERISPQETSA